MCVQSLYIFFVHAVLFYNIYIYILGNASNIFPAQTKKHIYIPPSRRLLLLPPHTALIEINNTTNNIHFVILLPKIKYL